MRLSPTRAALSAILVSTSIVGAQGARVTPDRVRFVLTALAHDSMQGRAMGTPGSMRAAAFIAEQFRLAGLKPAVDRAPSSTESVLSGYFQSVPLRVRTVDPASALTVDGATLKLGVDFATAPGPAKRAGIIVLHETTGRARHIYDVTARLAAAGNDALVQNPSLWRS